MKIIIAPDSFKGCLSASEVCDSIEKAVLKILPTAQVIKLPISDGGEGLVTALLSKKKGKRRKVFVKDPLFREIKADYGLLEKGVAVIEMAAASGLPLVKPKQRNPLKTTTYGTGELIFDAMVNQNCHKIILGIGGSATNDGGMGVASALGIKFYNKNKEILKPCGENLKEIFDIDLSKMNPDFLKKEIIIACDVDNPLCGERGSSFVYGPQKGADEKMIKLLDDGLKHFGNLLEEKTKKELIHLPGMGAAGGMALPFVAFFNAQLKSGLEIVLDSFDFDKKIKGADFIITGEGKTDAQSAMGKVISGVGKRGKKQKIPVFVVSGALEEGYEKLFDQGITAAFGSCQKVRDLNWQMKNATKNLEAAVSNLMRMIISLH